MVYNQGSGDTHQLDTLTAATLMALEDGVASLAQLVAKIQIQLPTELPGLLPALLPGLLPEHLPAPCPTPPQPAQTYVPDLTARVRAILQGLGQAGLVEAAVP